MGRVMERHGAPMRAAWLLLGACQPPPPAEAPPVVQLPPPAPAAAPPRSPPCELVETLVAMEEATPQAELSATYPAFRCARAHPLDRALAAVHERLADRARLHFGRFRTSVEERPLDAGPVYFDRHCRTDLATPALISVVCVDTRSGFAGERDQSAFDSLNLRLSPAGAAPFTALDLVRPEARVELLERLAHGLREADATRYREHEGPARASAAQVFSLTEGGLVFHLPEGEVGAVAEGSYAIELGWSALRPLLRPSFAQGPLRRLLQPATCEAAQGLCQDRCQDGFLPAEGRCAEGRCCVPDTSALPL